MAIICLENNHYTPAMMPKGGYPDEGREGFKTKYFCGRPTEMGKDTFRRGSPCKRKGGIFSATIQEMEEEDQGSIKKSKGRILLWRYEEGTQERKVHHGTGR